MNNRSLIQHAGEDPSKQRELISHLRREIIEGRLAPGNQLPTRREIERKFGITNATIQRAVDRLIRDGFVVAERPRGTFVAENPPHLCNYAMVFEDDATRIGWSRFYSTLRDQASLVVQQRPGRQLSMFYNVDGHEDREDYRVLLNDLRRQRIAGLIFARHPFRLGGTPLMEEFPNVPRVAIASESRTQFAGVYPDLPSFYSRAADHLIAQGKRRPAIVLASTVEPSYLSEMLSTLTMKGFDFAPSHLQGIDADNPRWAANAVNLLMQMDPKQRPDSLIIADDNLVESASAGLLASGARVPGDVEVVAHCNFPAPPPAIVPVKRLGFDVRMLLGACFDIIDARRRGDDAPATRVGAATLLPALFENELEAHHGPVSTATSLAASARTGVYAR